jgi:glycosyltransferase involved in cell wall biosynthesis
MKVLNVSSLLDTVIGGGTAERTVQMSLNLHKKNVDCTILTTNYGLSNKTRKKLEGIRIFDLQCISKRFQVPFPNLILIANIVKSSDIIHLMNHWSVLNAMAYFFARIYRKKYVVCPAGSLKIYGRSIYIKRIFDFFIGSSIIRNSQRCIAITEEEVSDFLKYGVIKEKIVIIPNGITKIETKEDSRFRKKFNLIDKKFALFVGRFNPIKGPDILVDAFINLKKNNDDLHLVLAGTDEGLLVSLKKKVIDSGYSNFFHFVGYLDGEEKIEAYRSAKFLVIPSRHEAMSIVVLEAGLYGTPSIFTDQCGLDFLNKLDAGFSVPVSVKGIETGIEKLTKNNDLIKSMGIKVKEIVLNQFEWNQVIKLYLNLYNDLLDLK